MGRMEEHRHRRKVRNWPHFWVWSTTHPLTKLFPLFDRVMIIFTVSIEDEMERALARLFLQQFMGAQKQVAQTPHCEFRRGNDPPKEIHSSRGSNGLRSTCGIDVRWALLWSGDQTGRNSLITPLRSYNLQMQILLCRSKSNLPMQRRRP